jgi:CheY-like chemotaxis protein
MRKYIKSLLFPYVKAVLEARDGQHALDLAVQHKPTLSRSPNLPIRSWSESDCLLVQTVLSDVTMPRMSGIEMLSKIRGNPDLASTPVVLM